MSKAVKPNIFAYDDYREYLADWFVWKKNHEQSFSYRVFCRRSGFKSANQFLLVIKGRRNISIKTIHRYLAALNLKEAEAKYFELLVKYNSAKDLATKAHYFKELTVYWLKDGELIKKTQYQYMSTWYYAAIREMVNLKSFKENGKWIAKKLNNLITPSQTEKAIEVLLEMKLLKRNDQGQLIQEVNYVTTGDEAQAVISYMYHEQMMKMAIKSMTDVKPKKRSISAMTFTINSEDFHQIKSKLNDFKKEVRSLIENREEKEEDDHIYQFCMQLFPLGM